eukprot:TRINITY_DN24815_c0_g1_i1.p1 TRINITY_DN24815_c0_g1~~TRINITY_DN24815_c0_g1_i1.p1  ORF type:complete len:355 (+),score=99.62 TRINITY_DN24815_c0_g1_i1:77-1141(+)
MSADKKEEKKLKSESKRQTNKENPEQVKKVEAELDEESSSEEEGVVKVSRVGYVEMRLKKKEWKAVYCVVIGGSFYYYKSSTDTDPKGHIDLAGHHIVSPLEIKGEKKKHTFSIQAADNASTAGENSLFIGSCGADVELKSWKTSLEEAIHKDKSDPPTVVAQKTKKQSVVGRAKKKAASKTATSALGKKVMKAIVNEETTMLLNSLKRIVKAESGSQKQADDLEKNIIKIAVKSFLLIENKSLSPDDFLVADKPLREAFELMVRVFNGRSRVKEEKIVEALHKVEELLKKAEEVITNLLAPHLTSKNMLRISSAFGCIASADFLLTVFKKPELEDDLDKLIDAMEYYTQFHYH